MVMIETPARIRALEIFKEYIQEPFAGGMPLHELENSFAKNVERIRNKLGGLECDNIKNLLSQSFQFDPMNEEAIQALISTGLSAC